MFRKFESLITTYPDEGPATPPRGFLAFMWECTRGVRGYIFAMTFCTSCFITRPAAPDPCTVPRLTS